MHEMKLEVGELEQEYRSQWTAFQPTRIRTFLGRVDEASRIELLARLIGIELEFTYSPPVLLEEEDDDERARPNLQLFMLQFSELKQHIEIVFRLSVLDYALRLKNDHLPPNPDSYLGFCDRSQERLIKLLRDTERMIPILRPRESNELPVGASDSTIKDTSSNQSIKLEPLPSNLGCFLLIAQVGKGGMGYVYSAIDLRSTAPVAVKVMRRIDPWSISRFIEEFTWLSQLNHPNLVRLYDAFTDGELRYFSMELVEGKKIRDWFERKQVKHSNPWNSLRKVLGQAASAIHYLHEHGVLHCDIKCSNLMITSRRRAVLLDLGLAVREGAAQAFVGTLHCMAPEILAGGRHSRASDWFSFGAMIFEAITGDALPVEKLDTEDPEEDSGHTHVRVKLDEVQSRLEGTDPMLTQLCLDLVHDVPGHRPKGKEVIHRFGEEYFATERFEKTIGRQEEIDELNAIYNDYNKQPSKLVVVSGESGIGKTSTVRKWLKQVDERNDLRVVLTCFRQDHTPLRLLNSMAQEVVVALQGMPEETWRPALVSRLPEMERAFPQIKQLIGDGIALDKPPPSLTPPNVIKARGMASLRDWLCELSQNKRLLFVIDDSQWADNESLAWLAEVLSHPSFDGLAIALDEPSSHHQEDRLCERIAALELDLDLELQEVEIQPLGSNDCEQLIRSWAEESAVDIAPLVVENMVGRCEGSPFLLQELFRAYIHYSKRDRLSDADWLKSNSQNNIRRRFGMLPIQSENVLQYLAIAEGPIGFHQLQSLSRIRPDELQRTLNLLASQGWVRSRTRVFDTRVVIAHDKFRKAVLDSMPKERKQRRHYRMARTLSSDFPQPWTLMGEHYWAAERYREGAACYVEAARNSYRNSHFQDSLRFLEKAAHPSAERSEPEEQRLLELKASCLAGMGASEKAAGIFSQISTASLKDEERKLNRCLAGAQWIRAGKLDEGIALLRDVTGKDKLRKAKLSLPAIGRQLSALWRSRPHKNVSHEKPLSPIDQSLLHVAFPIAFLDNQLGPGLILQLKDATDSAGSATDQTIAKLHWATLLSLGSWRLRKIAAYWLRVQSKSAKECQDPRAIFTSHMCQTIWHTEQGRYARSYQHYEKGKRWIRKELKDMHFEMQFHRWLACDCLWFQMKLEKLLDLSDEIRSSSLNPLSMFLGNVGACFSAYHIRDEIRKAGEALNDAEKIVVNYKFHPPWFLWWSSKITNLLYQGKSLEALDTLERHWNQLSKAYILSNQSSSWFFKCLRINCLMACARDDKSKASYYIREAKKWVKNLSKLKAEAYSDYAEILKLVLEHSKTSVMQWRAAIRRLEARGHLQFANAIQWHASLHCSELQEYGDQARAKFVEQGVKVPEKLMNTFLPLPE